MNLDTIYKELSTPLHIKAAEKITPWRNKSSSFPRKISFGIAIAFLGIVGLIDSLARIALAILTAPTELFGLHFAESLIFGVTVGGALSGYMLTIFQWKNIKGSRV